MTSTAYIQITWGELNRLGNRQLRETLARRLRAARREAATAGALQAAAIAAEIHTNTPRAVLGYEATRTHATTRRCPTCGVWTCAKRWQRVPHKCRRVEVTA